MKALKYDLEERLLEFSVRIIRVSESTTRSRAGMYVADQLMRSGISPYGHHGEAEGAESRDDFVHKLKVCSQELRETRRWLRFVQRVPLVKKPEVLNRLLAEAEELVRIFSPSLQTAKINGQKGRKTLNAEVSEREHGGEDST